MDGSQFTQTQYRNTAPARESAADAEAVVTELENRGRTARFVLRDRTREEHEATEAAFAPFDLENIDHYRAFLTAHAMALPRLELRVTGLGWQGWHPRYPRLADDLAALGIPLPAPMIAFSVTPVTAWGVQYVLEGSRLGGRVLSDRLPAGTPRRYLSPDPDMGGNWQSFCAAFDDACTGADWLDEVTDAAIDTFRAFRRGAVAMTEDLR